MVLLMHVGDVLVLGKRRLALNDSEPPRQSGPSCLTVTCSGRRPCRGSAIPPLEVFGSSSSARSRCGRDGLLGPRQSTTRFWQQRAASTVRSELSDGDVLGPTPLSRSGVPFAGGPRSLHRSVLRRGALRLGDLRLGRDGALWAHWNLLGPRQSTTCFWQQRAASTVRSELSDGDVLGPTPLSRSGVPIAGGPRSPRRGVLRRGVPRLGVLRLGVLPRTSDSEFFASEFFASGFLLWTPSGDPRCPPTFS